MSNDANQAPRVRFVSFSPANERSESNQTQIEFLIRAFSDVAKKLTDRLEFILLFRNNSVRLHVVGGASTHLMTYLLKGAADQHPVQLRRERHSNGQNDFGLFGNSGAQDLSGTVHAAVLGEVAL